MNFRDLNYNETLQGQLAYVGKKRGNPDNWDDNYMKLPSKASMDETPSLYIIESASVGSDEVAEIVLDGVTYTLDTPVAPANPADVTEALYAIMQKHTPEVINPVMGGFLDADDKFTFFYVATNVLTSIKVGSNVRTATVKATQFNESSFEFVVTKSTSGYMLNATSFDSAATEALTKAAVVAALATESVTQYDVVVTDIAGTSDQTVRVYVEGKSTPFQVDGVNPTYIETHPNFK